MLGEGTKLTHLGCKERTDSAGTKVMLTKPDKLCHLDGDGWWRFISHVYDLCICVYLEARGGLRVVCYITLYFISSRQGLLGLGLGWWLASPSELPFFASHSMGYRYTSHLASGDLN